MSPLKNRSLLSLRHHSKAEILTLLELAKTLKHAKKQGNETPYLTGKNLALIFEKTSTRTRCAFEVAAHDQGAQITYLDPVSSQIGHKESVKDSARVLGRMFDGIVYRGFGQAIVQQLADYSGVPVFNALTDEFHPTQMLADVLTMLEHSDKPLEQIRYAYFGDARNNIGNSLLLIGAKLGMDVRICAPRDLQPEAALIAQCQQFAQESGARLLITDNVEQAVRGVDFIHTDIWVSMGEPMENWDRRIAQLTPFRVNAELLAQSGNPNVKFMHCLPAFHNSETQIGEEISRRFPQFANGIEVTEQVFESPQSIVFDQAENRLHTIKAVLVAALGK